MSQRPLRAVDNDRLGGREFADTHAQLMESSERIQALLSNFVVEDPAQETIATLNEELRIAREREREAQDRSAALEELLASVRSSAAEAIAAADAAHQTTVEDLRAMAAVAIGRIDEFRRFQIGELQAGHRREASILRTGSLPAAFPVNSTNDGGVHELDGGVHELIEIETQKAQHLRGEGEWVDAIVAKAKQHTNERSEPLPWVKYDTKGRAAVLVIDGDSLAVAGWSDLMLHDARRELIRSLVLLAESSALQMDVLMGSNTAPDLTQGLPLRVRVRILRENVPVSDALTAISETYSDQQSVTIRSDEEFQPSGTGLLKFAHALRNLAGSSK